MREQVLPQGVKIVEVGPRDGLQNESSIVPSATKVELVRRLVAAGVRWIEAASFVSPKWVPQMADGAQVLRDIERKEGVVFSALVPNLKGLDAALAARCDEVAVFAAASETFSRKNINCSIAESIDRFAPVVEKALAADVRVRGYVSCVLGCPFEGDVDPDHVAAVAARLYRMGCYEISLGDTIGTGTPVKTRRMIDACAKDVPVAALAGHFHDTWGMATANVYAALQTGISTFDSSVSGIGGCPYSPGATGNVATEDVVYLCHELGIATGIDLAALIDAGSFISNALSRTTSSSVARASRAREVRLASV
ncbi:MULTISPECIES: hydroxymethylglutaryl-CoA lyase [Pandoraea]|uniref:hydroxymethylglutaryl-CoA lyase n=1 Tax=Pandoraea communis TaxID=2508297 RepID=A0A5E4RBW5_9BURK|nr:MULTISPECIES: hydroxymethylglutaryl-CoA lyase [Pandoraea]EON13782.1 pyruvate carboxyltransferase [Pandoraea sp. SD6-2]VVD60012.1 pyruvate carboxyltransferase [Pandoraea communis]